MQRQRENQSKVEVHEGYVVNFVLGDLKTNFTIRNFIPGMGGYELGYP